MMRPVLFETLEARRLLATVPAGFSDTAVVSNLSLPTAMALLPGGRMLITQQAGALRVVKNGALLAGAALNVTTTSTGERGLLGIAVDPDFTSNGHIYLYYTATSSTIHNRLSRFTMSGDSVVGGSEFVLLDLPTVSATNHNGGAIHFGGDGKLYVAVGENAVPSLSQQVNHTFGKMLRVNPDGTIPTDNPFYNTNTGINRTVWSLGLRNPYTFAVHPDNGRMFINDVGQNTWEEINEGAVGANYGWPTTEGDFNPATYPNFTRPLYSYQHIGGGRAIAGAAFYTPDFMQFPASYAGAYFFGDYVNGNIWTINPDAPPASGAAPVFATGAGTLVDIDVAPDGSVYYLQRNTSTTGQLGRIQYTANLAPTISTHPQSQTVSAGQPVTFSVQANGVPALQYQWQRNNQNINGATGSSYTISAAQLGDSGATFRVIVTNAYGSATSNPATLTVTANQPPVPTIVSPAAGATFGGGQSFHFSGSATAPEDGVLPASSLSWKVEYITGEVVRPFIEPQTGNSGSFVIPTVTPFTDIDVKYRITLTATDSQGIAQSVARDL
ncbi:MAG TPA: PQQ-dependent sugar dehydrogenase, partial [Tepidisphaeraceae bacterium]|nr:PQQ-dependent sugar dehydrogenase [Tepidisphaeraceae bacterium]